MTLYPVLSRAFSRFLGTDARWGHRGRAVPIYKILFANFSRLQLVARELQQEQTVCAAVAELEGKSRKIIEQIVAPPETADNPGATGAATGSPAHLVAK